jgi:hypothetical protein
MEAVPDLEDYLATAPITAVRPLNRGGVHRDKQLLVLEGGVGVVAKPVHPEQPETAGWVRAEVAAWRLAWELGFPDLVPTSVLRGISIPGLGDVLASLHVVWPYYQMALELSATVEQCREEDRWRVAIFDALAAHPDRHNQNWGFIESTPGVRLIDHGHTFQPGMRSTSPFAHDKSGAEIPDLEREHLARFLANLPHSRLGELLEPGPLEEVRDRVRTFVGSGFLTF